MLQRLSIIVLLLSATRVLAREPADTLNQLSVAAGAIHTRFVDEAFSHNRLRFAGTAFVPAASYERRLSKHGYFRTSLQGSKGRATSRHLPAEAEFYHYQLSFTWATEAAAWRVFGAESQLFAGAQIAAFDYMILDLEVVEDGAASFYYTANAYLRQRLSFNERASLHAELVLPLAGFVKRTSYDGGINQKLESDYLENPFAFFFGESRFSVLNPLQLPQLHVRYFRHFAANTSYVLHCQFHYMTNKQIAPVRLYSNSLLFGLIFHF